MSGPREAAAEVPRVTPVAGGPLLVEGPVEVVMPDGTVRLCERPIVALCTCRRTLRAPFCDTSHRSRTRRDRRPPDGKDGKDAKDGKDGRGAKDGKDAKDVRDAEGPAGGEDTGEDARRRGEG
ncbi:CDGSH iron-sulfur domain-containing protein [Streptomyces sp. NPDC053755]|uniref:CDGSH iron-sulfur domain-containing protein n=1 Tax=Streptomyces sp. NPDC053755 TaxID=3155815 RepID=UPI00342F7375